MRVFVDAYAIRDGRPPIGLLAEDGQTATYVRDITITGPCRVTSPWATGRGGEPWFLQPDHPSRKVQVWIDVDPNLVEVIE